ncbi:helix-turn-helix domain-containing protein [Streptomyces sp. NPDC046942]|uniref:helix-turn-helix domain-containing protein n=1 Tax=Streptomyces sp. NPDC046942 TaxID=3155137 RepID=UPI0033FEE0BC
MLRRPKSPPGGRTCPCREGGLPADGRSGRTPLTVRRIPEAARARGRAGGQKPKLGPRQVQLAREMYDEVDANGKQKWTVQQIADEFGVTRPTIYRHFSKVPSQSTATG